MKGQSMFNKPSTGDFLDPKGIVGHLIYIPEVIKHRTMPDKFNGGEKDTYTVKVVDLDGDGVLHERIMTTRWLVADFREGLTNFLGRVALKDTGKAKPAYVWDQPTAADEAKAMKWIESHKTGTFTTAQPQPQSQSQGGADDSLDALLADLA